MEERKQQSLTELEQRLAEKERRIKELEHELAVLKHRQWVFDGCGDDNWNL